MIWKKQKRLFGLVWAMALIVCIVGTIDLFSLPARSEDSFPDSEQATKQFDSSILLVPKDQVLGIALTMAAETWRQAALNLAVRLTQSDVEAFLNRALTTFQERVAKDDVPLSRQISAINLLYLSSDALANMLTMKKGDPSALAQVRSTEERIYAIIKQTGDDEPALAAISGGAMTMFAVVAGNLVTNDGLETRLKIEFDRRRQVDANISGMKEVGVAERLLLLSHNHLHGTLSMIQIIGLALAPEIEPKLADIERTLIKSKDEDAAVQIIEGGKALTRSSLLIAPLLNRISSSGSPRPMDQPKR